MLNSAAEDVLVLAAVQKMGAVPLPRYAVAREPGWMLDSVVASVVGRLHEEPRSLLVWTTTSFELE